MINLSYLNSLSVKEAEQAFHRCCGSQAFARGLAVYLPFPDEQELLRRADEIWFSLGESDWLEAFSHHPRIGEKQLAEKFKATEDWSKNEQAGTAAATPQVIAQLAEGNRAYEEKFGFVFLICATGKSATEMLAAQQSRLGNTRAEEIANAVREQALITRLRLEKIGVS